ncbi:hypothetical protein SDJN03_09209, partial [Cucurbita argyrosperma subsp. sororia]
MHSIVAAAHRRQQRSAATLPAIDEDRTGSTDVIISDSTRVVQLRLTHMANRVKEDEKNERIIRGSSETAGESPVHQLQQSVVLLAWSRFSFFEILVPRKEGPQYVSAQLSGTFVCTTCSGIQVRKRTFMKPGETDTYQGEVLLVAEVVSDWRREDRFGN